MATTLEELVVKIQADVEGLKSDFADATKATIAATDQMSKAVQGFSDSGKKSFLDFSKVAETAMGVFSGEALLEGVKHLREAFADVFKEVIVEGVKAASANEETVTRLNFALAQVGQYSQDTSHDLREFAESLQKTTKYEQDQILATEATIESLGRLDSEGLKRATKAAVDLASGLKIDLQTATMLVGKAAAGEIGTFSRYGLVMTEGATKAETFALAMKKIEGQFRGAAAAQVQTFGGSVDQLHNNFADLGKELGFTITQNEAVVSVLREAKQILEEFTNWVKQNQADIKKWVAEGLVTAIEAINGIVVALDAVVRVSQIAWEIMTLPIKTYIAAVVAAQEALKGNFAAAFDVMKGVATDAGAGITKALTGDSALGGVSQVLFKMEDAAKKGFDSMASGAKATHGPLNQAASYTDHLTLAQVKMGEAGAKAAKKLTEFNPGEYFKEQTAMVKAQLDLQQISAEDFMVKQHDLFQQARDEERAELNEAHKQGLISNTAYQAALTSLEKKQSAERMQQAAAEKQFNDNLLQQRLGYASQTFGAMSSLMRTKNKELFEIGKQAAAAQAIVDGYAAVQRTMASVPYPFNIPLAIAQGIAGAVNVANIEAQQFSSGTDSVPGMGFGDKVPAFLEPKERVVPSKTNEDLTQFLAKQGQGGDNSAILQAIYGALQRLAAQPVNVMVDGRTLVTAMRDQIRAGREVFA